MDAYVAGFDLGTFQPRPLIEALTNLDASGWIDTSSRAVVTARRYTDASKSTRLPNKLAGLIFRLRNNEGYRGYAITAKDKRLCCRELGGFASDDEAKQAIAEEYGKRDGHPLQR
jgi:hypothetical protein